MNKYFYLLVSICLSLAASAQHKTADTAQVMAMNTRLHADPRLDIILKKVKQGSGNGSGIYSGHGYRVQIYSGNDRSKAAKMKIDFQRRFPSVHAYMTYASPQFRIKVGDFRSRGEAMEMYHNLSTLYNPCMIVPDIVVFRNLNTHKDNDDRSNPE